MDKESAKIWSSINFYYNPFQNLYEICSSIDNVEVVQRDFYYDMIKISCEDIRNGKNYEFSFCLIEIESRLIEVSRYELQYQHGAEDNINMCFFVNKNGEEVLYDMITIVGMDIIEFVESHYDYLYKINKNSVRSILKTIQ
ncbi:hypothetical protein [Desulfopila sp. IMCC35008]|uniref:hypothetical protein n=1 Tax=Desulfopila sp. IMCC35008 TaxID=2653858 RepID=UPI0013D1AB05|nr:hypothetical protein [Desulfopila sp. IMCC35008]